MSPPYLVNMKLIIYLKILIYFIDNKDTRREEEPYVFYTKSCEHTGYFMITHIPVWPQYIYIYIWYIVTTPIYSRLTGNSGVRSGEAVTPGAFLNVIPGLPSTRPHASITGFLGVGGRCLLSLSTTSVYFHNLTHDTCLFLSLKTSITVKPRREL